MDKIYISYPMAKNLKTIGYDAVSDSSYMECLKSQEDDLNNNKIIYEKGDLFVRPSNFVNKHEGSDDTSEDWYMCARPTVDEVIQWIRERLNFTITVNSLSLVKHIPIVKKLTKDNFDLIENSSLIAQNTYEMAQVMGIAVIIKELLNKKK